MDHKTAYSTAAFFACSEGDSKSVEEFVRHGGERPQFPCARNADMLRDFLERVGLVRKPAFTIDIVATRSAAGVSRLTPTDYALIYAARHGATASVEDATEDCDGRPGCAEATKQGLDIAWGVTDSIHIAALCEATDRIRRTDERRAAWSAEA